MDLWTWQGVGKREGEMDWESSADIQTLLCVKEVVESCYIAQGTQPGGLWWPTGLGWRLAVTETQDGGDMYVLTDDSPCTAQINTALQSDYTSVKKNKGLPSYWNCNPNIITLIINRQLLINIWLCGSHCGTSKRWAETQFLEMRNLRPIDFEHRVPGHRVSEKLRKADSRVNELARRAILFWGWSSPCSGRQNPWEDVFRASHWPYLFQIGFQRRPVKMIISGACLWPSFLFLPL